MKRPEGNEKSLAILVVNSYPMSKQQYLSMIRSGTAYPVYRGVISTITMLLYLVAIVCGASALFGGLGSMTRSFVAGLGILIFGLIFAAIYFFLGRFFKEASLILADIGDSVIDTNARLRVEPSLSPESNLL
jgi:hypothetical protein